MIEDWELRPFDPAVEEGLLKRKVKRLHARLLAQRGIAPGAETEFFSAPMSSLSSPSSLYGIRRAASVLLQASLKGDTAAVIGDYDVDGITSSVMARNLCASLGLACKVFLPSRQDHGYGLNERTVSAFVKDFCHPPPHILIVCDSGSSSEAIVRRMKGMGVKHVIVIDHHIVDKGSLSESADALVNWRLGGTELCAAGEVYMLARALEESASGVDSDQYLPLAAVATVADVMPVSGDNRVIVKNGLRMLRNLPNIGLAVLSSVSGLDPKTITQEDVAFKIAPRLNASGRLATPDLSYRLLLSTDYLEANEIANELDFMNKTRRGIQKQITDECVRKIGALGDRKGILVIDRNWHTGVVGIVAAELCRKYGVPALVMGSHGDRIKGSGRSVPGVSIKAVMDRCSGLFSGYGGHEAAAGATLQIGLEEEAPREFNKACRDHFDVVPPPPARLFYDADLKPTSIDEDSAIETSELFHPFNEGTNPEPVFKLSGITVSDVKVKEGDDWRLVAFTGSCNGLEIPMRFKMFSDTVGEGLEGSVSDILFTFPQKKNPKWGSDLSVVEVCPRVACELDDGG